VEVRLQNKIQLLQKEISELKVAEHNTFILPVKLLLKYSVSENGMAVAKESAKQPLVIV